MKKQLVPIVALMAVGLLVPGCFNRNSNNSSSIIDSGASLPEQEFTVTFNFCNGNAKDNIRKTGKTGESIKLPDGKNFGAKVFYGWSTKYSPSTRCGTLDDIIQGKTITIGTDNIVLYAAYQSAPDHTDAEVDAYMADLKTKSQNKHLYYHYYRFNGDYSDWDVWAWSYKPNSGEGAKFDWKSDIDDFGGAYVDIDLTATYDGGWNADTKVMGGTPVTYSDAEQIGLQIVKTATRKSGSGFWVNDGSNLYVALEDYRMDLNGGGVAYHVFVVQDNVQEPKVKPSSSNVDPFSDDDGTNVTYGNNSYDNVNWNSTPAKTQTAEDFKDIGVGYQIMVSSFSDSDKDGFGDIYGITKKLDYLEQLGVKALWLTPIQLSDSYHGYDITDYEMVDPKFGSKVSEAGIANGGEVTAATALADYKQLIQEAHARGIKIVMDLVLNHTSTSNKWFVKSANLDSNYRGYYQWGNYKTQSGTEEFWEDCFRNDI